MALNQVKDVYDQLDTFDRPFALLDADDFTLLHLELIGDLQTGDFLGHNAYIANDGKHYTTARTTQPTTIYTLSQVEIARVVRIEPTVAIQLQYALTQAMIAQRNVVGRYLYKMKRGNFLKSWLRRSLRASDGRKY